jgi:RNA polymerase sigma factor (sigma-70 family)
MSHDLRPLIDAARGGDRGALNTLAACVDRFVRIFSGSLSEQVRRSQGSTIDFVLEGLAEALSKLEGFEYSNDQEFYAWAGRFIRHRIIDAGRRESRQRRSGRPHALGDLAGQVADAGPTASQIASREEVRAATGRALLELQLEHPGEMHAVLLKVFEGQSWPEVKEAMGLSSEKRARTLVARGLELLRPRLESLLGGAVLEEFIGP